MGGRRGSMPGTGLAAGQADMGEEGVRAGTKLALVAIE